VCFVHIKKVDKVGFANYNKRWHDPNKIDQCFIWISLLQTIAKDPAYCNACIQTEAAIFKKKLEN